MLILLPHLREADSFSVQTNDKREIDFGDVTYLSDESPSITSDVKEEANHNDETMARQKRTTLTTTIDGKFTVHLTVMVKPAEQQVPPQMTRGGRLRSAGRSVHDPISRNCQNEYCDFAMELELLEKQVSTPVDSTGSQETNKNRMTIEGQVKPTPTPDKTVAKYRSSSRMYPTTTTTTRYPMMTPSINQVLDRTKTAETTTRYPTLISRSSSVKHVVNKTQRGGRYQTTTARTPANNVTRINRMRTTSRPPSRDLNEDYLFLEQRNENGPNKSRASQQELNRIKSPKAATRLFQATRIQKKKEAEPDVIVTTEKNEPTQTTTDNQVQMENVNNTDIKPDDLNGTLNGPLFRNSVEHLNSSTSEISIMSTTPATRQMTINDTVPLTVRIMSNVTQSDEINIYMEPVSIQNDSFVTQSNGQLDIPLESSGNLTPTEQTLLNPTEIGVPLLADSQVVLPWEQIGDFEFQINPISKQVINIRIQTTTPTTAPYNSITISYEEKENSSLNQGERQEEILLDVVESGTPAATLEIPTTVIPTQTVTPTVKMPIPLNRRKPISVAQPERVDTPLESGRDYVIPIAATPMGVPEHEQSVITEGIQTSTTQNPELFRMSGEYKQMGSVNTETVTNISVQQTTIPENSPSTEIYISDPETVTSEMKTPIEEDIPRQSKPATAEIQPPIPINLNPKIDGQLNVLDKMYVEPVRELAPPTTIVTSMAPVIPIQTTSTSTILELSEEFPWEQRHDYEVQVNPKTNQVVNIRMLKSTTHNPLSVLPVEVPNDHNDTTAAPDSTQMDSTKTNESVLTAEEQDELTVQVLGRILDRNGKIRTLVVPHRPKDNIGEHILIQHSDQVDDDFPDGKVGTRFAVTAPPKKVSSNGRDRSVARKPIFSHTSEDGVFYFRYANEEDELNHYAANGIIRNKQIMDDERETDLPQRQSPYFYYSQDRNSSALVKSSCFILLLVAYVSFLFL